MAKGIPKEEIFELVSRYPEGASIEEIMLGMESPPSRRTLQRWLANLVKSHSLTIKGKARAVRYKLSQTKGKPSKKSSLIPLSLKGTEIESIVTQPIQLRRPIGYNREFLEAYLPNQTFYLSKKTRDTLYQLTEKTDGKYPAGTFTRQIFHRLLIDLSWNSSRLEGNTYSFLETERLLDTGKVAEGKNLQETQMILNHKAAIEFLMESVDEIKVDRYTILNLHSLLSENLLPNSASCGKLRSFPVGIEKSVYIPSGIPQQIDECFTLLIEKAAAIHDPLEQSFFLLVHIPYLQPFEDVNKRTSRIAANIPLIKNNLAPLSFIDLPYESYINGLLGIYELNQVELFVDIFSWTYERSSLLYSVTSQSIKDPDPFKMKYRNEIQEIISKIVKNKENKSTAAKYIHDYAIKKISTNDRLRFIEIAERELLSLHEGNIARYGINLKEFHNWIKKFI